MKNTCGDYGGKKRDGEPCTRTAGWGRSKDTGPCKHHPNDEYPDELSEKRKAVKEAFLDLLATGEHTFASAAKQVGSSVTSIWRWRKAEPTFDQACDRWKKEADAFRIEMVEDTLFARLIAGKATAAEMIFYLANRAPHRWRHVSHIEVAGPDGGPMEVEHTNAREALTRRVTRIASRIGADPPDSRLN